MSRILYRCLIWFHPRGFREQFGEEMLWVFDEAGDEAADDESARRNVFYLFGDGLVSLARQWLLRSGIWRFGIGAIISGLLIWSFGYSIQLALVNALRRGSAKRAAEVRQGLASEISQIGFSTAAEAVVCKVESYSLKGPTPGAETKIRIYIPPGCYSKVPNSSTQNETVR